MYNDQGINATRKKTIVNIYASETGTHKYIKQILTNKEIDSNAKIVGDFNTSLTSVDRSSR